MTRLTVGLVGCGQAAQAIHLPALASLPERFVVTHVNDADPVVAAEVARRVGAEVTGDVIGKTDVIAIASPNHLHAEQMIAACEAGVRGVLIEKPFTLDAASARRIVETATDTKIVVDTHHAYDPAWTAARKAWGDLPQRAHLCRITTIVSPNAELVAAQTQPAAPSMTFAPSSAAVDMLRRVTDMAEPSPELQTLAGFLLGLTTHDLPLIRQSVGLVDTVEHARLFGSGYEIVLRAGRVPIHLTAWISNIRTTDWAFELIAPDRHVRVEFPPSYLSGVATRVRTFDASGVHEPAPVHETGYRAAWRDLHQAVTEGTPVLNGPDGALADHELIEAILRHAARH